MIPRIASSRRERSPPERRADLLEGVVAAEQEAGQVAARLAGRHRDLAEQRVEDRLAVERVVADLGEVPKLDVGPELEPAVAGRELAGDRPQQGGLAGAVGPDDADPLAPRRVEADRRGRPRVRRGGPPRGPPGAGRPRPNAGRACRGHGPGAAPDRSVGSVDPVEAGQARLVLVHLPVLALAPVRLDQRLLPRDLRLARLGLLGAAGRRAPRAGGRRRSSRRGRRSGAGRGAPRRGSRSRRGRPGRARRPAGRPGAAGPAPPATRAPRGPGGSSARRGGAGPGPRPGGAPAQRGSAGRRTAPPASGRISSGVKPRPESASSTRWSSVQPSTAANRCWRSA